MKLLRLDLKAFGPFTERSLALAPNGQTLVLIHGPNEAGKSATLRAISDLRFGIPVQSADNFIHAHPDMRIGGLFEDRDGRQHELVRRKGRGSTLSMVAADGALPTPAIEALLTSGLSKADHDSMFGLDHQQLRQGGEALLKGEGEVGAALFEASAGIRSVPAILDQIDQAARAYFIPGTRGRNGVINEALRSYQEQHDGLRRALVRPASWQELARTHKAGAEKLAALELQRAELNARHVLNTELRAVAPLLASLDQASAIAAALADTIVLGAQAQSERAAAQTGLAQSLQAADAARLEVQRQQVVLAAHANDQPALELASAIDRLGAAVEAIDRYQLDLAQAEVAVQQENRALDALAREIAPAAPTGDVVDMAPSPTVRAQIAQAMLALERACQALVQQRETSRLPADDSQAELAAPLPLAERAALNAARAQVLQSQSMMQRRRALPSQIAAVERALQAALVELRLENENALHRAQPLPLEEIDTAMQRQQHHATRVAELDKRIAAIDAQRGIDEGQRHRMLAAGAIPTADQVAAARGQRDAAWAAVLAQWLEGAEGVTAAELHEDLPAMAPLQRDAHSDAGSSQDGTATLPGPAQALGHAGLLALARAYEHSVAHADRLIDALARDLQRAEQLQALDHALQILATDRASLVGEKEQLARAEQQRQDEWLALLAAAGLPAVMPQGLRAWQSALSQARSQCEQRALLGEELASADAAALELGRVLQAAIAAIHGNAVASTLPLHQLAALADELEAELKQRETRYNNAIGKQQARQQQQQLAAAREQELALRASQAQLAMANLLPLLQLDSADGLESARARLLQFDTLLLARDRRDQALTLAARAQAALSVLQQQAQSLAMCLGDQGDLPVPALRLYVEQLAARLAKARKIQSAHALAAHALELAQQTVERETALAQAHESMLAQLCRNAGVAHPSMLPEAELRARRKQDALADVERTQRQLQQASRRTETQLRDLLRNHDAVRLDADEALLNQEREALEDRLRQARTLEEQSRHALAAVDSGDEAVVFQQGMERASAHVRGALAPWMRTRLAHGLLAEAQKRFRERAQGPMLSSASAFFCNMTAAEFTGLASDESREGVAPVLLAMRRDGRPVRVEQLSEGTRDQLYLALRLAALDLRRQAGVDMPLVLDDVLMTSDDRRAALMLQTLAGFSRHGQVIVFTHHAHLIDVARRAVASDVLSVVEL